MILADLSYKPFAAKLAQLSDVLFFEGREIGRELAEIKKAEALFIRSTTNIDDELVMSAPKLRFIGTATAGTDHITVSQRLKKKQNLSIVSAGGENALSVGEYLLSIVVYWLSLGRLTPHDPILIFGCGNTGSRFVRLLKAMSFKNISVFDPWLTEAEIKKRTRWHVIETKVLADLNTHQEELESYKLLSFHVPLERGGLWPTSNYIPNVLKPLSGSLLINSSRGEVWNESFFLENADQFTFASDVFLEEPQVNFRWTEKAKQHDDIITPHIAGRSLDAKLNGARKIITEFLRSQRIADVDLERESAELKRVQESELASKLSESSLETRKVIYLQELLKAKNIWVFLHQLLESFFPLISISEKFKQEPRNFEEIRNGFPRFEFSNFLLHFHGGEDEGFLQNQEVLLLLAVLEVLGFRLHVD